jgi:3-oxoacyl-[acyl-carrier-protein] synthase-1
VSDNVYVTGIGIITAVGSGTQETWDSIVTKRSGIQPIRHLDSRHRGLALGGEVNASNADLGTRLGLSDVHLYSRTALLGMLAAQDAWDSAGAAPSQTLRTGIVSSTTVGGIDRSELFFREYLQDGGVNYNVRGLISHDCGDSTERIAMRLGIHDFVTTISTACSSSANAIMLGSRMIRAGKLDRVVAGGTDALTIYTLNGFNALKILDESWCRPFDQNRNGLNLGEGAAYLVLESAKALKYSGNTPYCRVAGYGNTNDAYHQTASSPDGSGAFKAMEEAMQVAGMTRGDIDYINAHGTATPNNDLSEGLAIARMFADSVPPFSSTKAFTGHTLAAAGAIEAVLSVLSIKHQRYLPNLNFHTPIEEIGLSPVTEPVDAEINTILSNSFGFGGNCSSLIFSRS